MSQVYQYVREVEDHTCPFCGSGWADIYTKAHRNGDYMIFCVTCMDCEAKGPWHYSEAGAIERWDWRRAPNPGSIYLAVEAHLEAVGQASLTPVDIPAAVPVIAETSH